MTQLVEDLDDFPKMHYITDLTHVSFFSRETLQYLAKKEAIHVEFKGDNLIFFHKQRAN
jgi:trehalose-6-phosphate synthase